MSIDKFPRMLAVYGTLKRGYHNHRLIEGAGLQFFGSMYTREAKFTLQGGRGFPIVRDGGDQHIMCELYQFDEFKDIAAIDRLEGYPSWYNRRPIEFTNRRQAWMYVQDYEEGQSYPTDRVQIKKGIASWL